MGSAVFRGGGVRGRGVCDGARGLGEWGTRGERCPCRTGTTASLGLAGSSAVLRCVRVETVILKTMHDLCLPVFSLRALRIYPNAPVVRSRRALPTSNSQNWKSANRSVSQSVWQTGRHVALNARGKVLSARRSLSLPRSRSSKRLVESRPPSRARRSSSRRSRTRRS